MKEGGTGHQAHPAMSKPYGAQMRPASTHARPSPRAATSRLAAIPGASGELKYTVSALPFHVNWKTR